MASAMTYSFNVLAYQNVIIPGLELATPKTTKIYVVRAIIIGQDGRVNAISSLDVALLGLELAIGCVRLGYTNPEYAFLILGREEQVVLTVLLGRIRGPKLLACPWDIGEIKDLSDLAS